MLEIATLVDGYKSNPRKKRRKELLRDILRYYTERGAFEFRDQFWSKLNLEEQESFVEDLFNYLISCESTEKIMVLELLEAIYLEFTVEKEKVKKKLFSIFYAALFEKKNYQLALSALKFFSILWKRTDSEDPLRKEIFPKLLDFIDNDIPILAEEGIYETLNLIESSLPSQKRDFFEQLLIMATKKDYRKHPEVQYAILNTINEIITLYLPLIQAYPPERISEVVQEILKCKYFRHPKPIMEMIKLIFRQKIPLSKEAEMNLLALFERAKKKMTYEYRAEFWNYLYQFLEMPTDLPKRTIIDPFLEDIMAAFQDRGSLSAEVKAYLESLVNLMWGLDVLTEKERRNFY